MFLFLFLFLSRFTCIVLTEIWLTPETDNCFKIPGFYCFNLYRNRHGGGIKIFLRHVVQAKLLDEYTFIGNLFEAITIELVFGQNKVFLCCVYHPPTPSVAENNDFIDSFINHIKLLSNVGVPLVTAGDFNLNLFNPNKYVYVDHFVNSMFEVGMAPIITIPTKVNPDNHLTRFSLIDHDKRSLNT